MIITGAPSSGGRNKSNFVPQNQTCNTFALKPPPTEHIRRQQPPVSQNSSDPLSCVPNLAPQPPSKQPLLVPTSSSGAMPPTMTSSLQKLSPVSEQQRSGMVSPLVATPTSLASSGGGNGATAGLKKNGGLLKTTQQPSSTHGLVDPRLKHSHSHEQQQLSSDSCSQQKVLSMHNSTTGGTVTNSGGGGSGEGLNLKSDRTPAPNGLTMPVKTPVPPSSSSSSSSSSSWLMDGPSSNVLLLSSHNSKDSRTSLKSSSHEGSDKRDVGSSRSPVIDAASAITSQFLQHAGAMRDETGGTRTVDHIQSSLQQTGRGIPLGIGREIPLPLIQGTVPMTSSRLPSPASIAAVKLEGHPQGIFDKRAVVSAQNLVSRRASATANGTPYPEIFHTTARRFSETTERGLKQALAG